MADADSQQDPGRADYVPTGSAAQVKQTVDITRKID